MMIPFSISITKTDTSASLVIEGFDEGKILAVLVSLLQHGTPVAMRIYETLLPEALKAWPTLQESLDIIRASRDRAVIPS